MRSRAMRAPCASGVFFAPILRAWPPMKDRPANLPASISARLRNIARAKQANPELILRRYALERLLSRLSLSPYHDRFILKGAMLFTVWLADPFRPTKDLDLLGFGDTAVQSIAAAFR